MYQIKLEKFEGPLELLLELIKKEKLSITELSLAKVADEYLEFVRNNQNITLESLADFLDVASRLILIKSRALLPTLKFSDEEEEEIADLAYRLEEYGKFKEIFSKVGKIWKNNRSCFSREPFQETEVSFSPPENLNVFDLKKCFLSVLAEIPVIEKLQEEIVNEVITLEERINELENILRNKAEISFFELTQKSLDKIDVIVSFLAMLEMAKQRIAIIQQENSFEDIRITWNCVLEK